MFSSPEQALRFAFKIRFRPIISKSHNVFLVKEKQKNKNQGALTAFDLHAQGAMIISHVENLGDFEAAWMYWSYGTTQERQISARYLANRYQFGTVSCDRDQIYRVLFYGSVRRAAVEMQVSKSKAWRIRRQVLDCLYPLERRVSEDLWSWMLSDKYE